MKPTQKQPEPLKNVAVTEDELIAAYCHGDVALKKVAKRLLTERDEALNLLATERDNFGKLETELKAEASEDLARHLIQADATIMAEKRRTAALVEVAMMSSGKSRETILAEAQKLIAPKEDQ